MDFSLFEDAVTLYEKNSATTITRYRVEYFALGKFCVSLNGFYTLLGESASEDYWQKFLIPLKRLQFALCAVPFSKEYRFERISSIVEELQLHLRFCQKLYPEVADQALAILDLLTDLCEDCNNPLLDKLLELTDANQNIAWVIKESRFIPYIEELVTEFNLSKLSIVHPLQLKDLTCYDQLIIIGPSRWFPESIFTAPRSSQIAILIFDWIRDRWKPQNVFVSPHKSSGPSNRKYITIEERETVNRWDNIDAESLLNIINKTSSVIRTLDNGNRDKYEDIEAICVFLEDEWAVFIDANEGAKTLVIDPDEDTDERVTRVSGKNIQPGTFILVKTGGGGDYIVPIADKIMGNLAQQARKYQKYWKDLLKNRVKEKGLLETCLDLIDLGSSIADEINVRNWISPRSIRTQNRHDFFPIMELIGLKDQADEYWNMMSQIRKAHQKAGFEIRNSLLSQVRELTVEDLQKRGKMDFKLSNDDEGGITAYRVESVLKELVEVPYSHIGHPFKLAGHLWHE